MPKVALELGNDLAALLRQTNQPLKNAILEMVVLELYRRGSISSGKAGEVLGMPRWEFVRHASRLGIPYFDMTEEEWEAELAEVDAICRSR
jgi:predicted HTH domain antitoxin